MTKEVIETLGYIIKKESLASHKTNLNFSELVLEDMAPFPGYYDHYNVPQHTRDLIPNSVFAVIKSFDGKVEDDFIRLTHKIKLANPNLSFDAVFGDITLLNMPANIIRINLDNLTLLPEIIHHYQDGGIVFMKDKKVKKYSTIIRVRKFLEMKKVDDAIYHCFDDPHMYYMFSPGPVEWDRFEKIAKSIRNNYDYKHFDAAMGSMYIKCGLKDFVRIYSEDIDLEKLRYLRDKFQAEIARAIG